MKNREDNRESLEEIPASKAKTAAERMRLYRERQRQKLSPANLEKLKAKEKKRIADYRTELRATEAGRTKLAQSQKMWKEKWESGLSRQKKDGLNISARNRMAKLRKASAEKAGNLSAAMHRIWKKKESTAASTPSIRTKHRKARRLQSTVQQTASSPNTRADIVCDALRLCSPATKSALQERCVLADKGTVAVITNIQQSAKHLRKAHTKDAFGARRALLTAFTSPASSKTAIAKATGFDRRAVAAAVSYHQSAKDILYIRMQRRTRSDAISPAVTRMIHDFFLEPAISRTMPSKRDVVRVQVEPGIYEDVPKQILECSLTEAYREFKARNPNIKVGQRSFETRRPRQVISAKASHRLVCGCIYHFRIHYLLQAINNALKITQPDGVRFSTVSDMVGSTLCPAEQDGHRKVECIERRCQECGISQLKELLMHDSDSCACPQQHGVKACLHQVWKGYEYKEVPGVKQKRLTFTNKQGTLDDLVNEATEKLGPFAEHCFLAYWTYGAYRQLLENLPKEDCVFILDFAENFSCRVFHEVQSLHWVNVQATLLIIVAIRHPVPADGEQADHLVEDHFVMITDDLNHDVWAVQHGRKLAVAWMQEHLGLKPKKIWDVSNGAASQFKCSTSFLHISSHEEDFDGIEVEHLYWATAHGKGKADGVGGVVKHKAAMAVVKKQIPIRNAKELHTYCSENLTTVGNSSTYESRKKAGITMNRMFFYVPKEGPDAVQRPDAFVKPKTVPGTRNLHSVKAVKKGEILCRKYPCMCEPCIHNQGDCENPFVGAWRNVTLNMLTDQEPDAEAIDHEEPDTEIQDDVELAEEDYSAQAGLEATIVEGSLVIVRPAEQLYDYYLIKAKTPVHVLESSKKDDYGHTFEAGSKVLQGHYLELVPRQERQYYEDNKIVIVLSTAVASLCPPLQQTNKNVRRKKRPVFTVSEEDHEILLNLVR